MPPITYYIFKEYHLVDHSWKDLSLLHFLLDATTYVRLRSLDCECMLCVCVCVLLPPFATYAYVVWTQSTPPAPAPVTAPRPPLQVAKKKAKSEIRSLSFTVCLSVCPAVYLFIWQHFRAHVCVDCRWVCLRVCLYVCVLFMRHVCVVFVARLFNFSFASLAQRICAPSSIDGQQMAPRN